MSTLDLTFASPNTAGRIQQCRPCEELDSDSDHIPVITSVQTDIPNLPREHPLVHSGTRLIEAEVRKTLAQKISDLKARSERLHLLT